MEVSHTSSVVANRLLERPELNQNQQQNQPRPQQTAGVEVQISREARTTFASQAALATQPLTLSEPPVSSTSTQAAATDLSQPVTIEFDAANNNAAASTLNNTVANQNGFNGSSLQANQSSEAAQNQQSLQTVSGSTTANTDEPETSSQTINNNLNSTIQQPVVSQVQTPVNQVALNVDIREVIPDAGEGEVSPGLADNQAQQNESNSVSQGLNVSADAENEITSVVAPAEENAQANEPDDVVTIPNPTIAQPDNPTANQVNNNAAEVTAAEEPVIQPNTSAAIDQFRQVALSDQERQIIESFDV